MSSEYRRGRNWFTAMGVLFVVVSLVALAQNLIIWGPGFVLDFILSSDITNEKISVAVIIFGCLMIIWGFRKKNVQKR